MLVVITVNIMVKGPLFFSVYYIFQIICIASFHTLIWLNVCHSMQIHWALVFVPVLVLEMLFVVKDILESSAKYEENGAIGVLLNFRWNVIRISFVILLIFKLQTNNFSWLTVFSPIYASFPFIFGTNLLQYFVKVFNVEKEDKKVLKHSFVTESVILLLAGIFMYSFFILLHFNIEFRTPNILIVCIPIFIVLGFLTCCFAICLPCAVFGFSPKDNQENVINHESIPIINFKRIQ